MFIFVWQMMMMTCRYLTSKLVADSLMWQQTFRNDSPSPEEWPGHSPEEVIYQLSFVSIYPFLKVPGARPRPSSLVNEGQQGEIVIAPVLPVAPDPKVLEDLEKEARRLATEVSYSGIRQRKMISCWCWKDKTHNYCFDKALAG